MLWKNTLFDSNPFLLDSNPFCESAFCFKPSQKQRNLINLYWIIVLINACFQGFLKLTMSNLFLENLSLKNYLDNLKLWYKTFLNGLKGLKYIQNIFAHSSSFSKELWGFKSWFFDFLVFKAKWPLEQLYLIIWNLLE